MDKISIFVALSIATLLMPLSVLSQTNNSSDIRVFDTTIPNFNSNIEIDIRNDLLHNSPGIFSDIQSDARFLTKQSIKYQNQQKREQNLDVTSMLALTASRPLLNLEEYAAQCAITLGAAMPNFDCVADGVEIPITQNGNLAAANQEKCDSPALLSGDESCALGARLGHIPTDNPDVDIVFICRKYAHVPDDLYQDIAVIHHNKRTGGTCWYQSGIGKHLRMRKEVGSPLHGKDGQPRGRNDLPNEAQYVTWYEPGEVSCHRCHQADPYIRTPYVNQVEAMGSRVLPANDDDSPYWHYKLQEWNEEMKMVVVTDENEPAKNCVGCHRIGSNGSSCKFIDDAGGDPIGNQKRHDLKPNHAWMHASGNSFGRLIPSAETKAAVVQLKDCCAGGIQGVCHLKSLPGRADTFIKPRYPTQYEFNRTNVLPGVVNFLSAKLVNADADDQIFWETRNENGQLQEIGTSASDTNLLWRPACKAGSEIDIIVSGVTKTGSKLVNVHGSSDHLVSRKLIANCVSIGNTDVIREQNNKIYAYPIPSFTASLTPNKVIVKGLGSALIVGDDEQDNPIRTLISFQPAWPSEATEIISARLRFLFGKPLGNPLTDPSALKVTLYDYEPPLDTNDFVGGRFLPGLISIDTRLPVGRVSRNDPGARSGNINVNITELVQDAFTRRRELQNRIPLAFYLKNFPRKDGRAEQISILNKVRSNYQGLPSTENLLRPMLEITYKD